MFPPTTAATLHSWLTYSKRDSDHRRFTSPTSDCSKGRGQNQFWLGSRLALSLLLLTFAAIPYHLAILTSLDTPATWVLAQCSFYGFAYKQKAGPNSESGLVISHSSLLQQSGNYVTASLLVLHQSSHWIRWGNTVHSPSLIYQLGQRRQWTSGRRGINPGHLTFCFAARGCWERLQCLERDQVSLSWEETVWS